MNVIHVIASPPLQMIMDLVLIAAETYNIRYLERQVAYSKEGDQKYAWLSLAQSCLRLWFCGCFIFWSCLLVNQILTR